MAVYTHVSFDSAAELLNNYALGQLEKLEGIVEGVENSNYKITTSQGLYILTLFEKRVKSEDLPFYMDAMTGLAKQGITCPQPIADTQGKILQNLCGRPAAITSFLLGTKTNHVTTEQCQQVGNVSAGMHMAGKNIKAVRSNALSIKGWAELVQATQAQADTVKDGLRTLIIDELAFLEKQWPQKDALPTGIIHADLFQDNVFFKDNKLSGVIDFYFACIDFWAYDLAITMNAWCFADEKHYTPERVRALLQGYEKQRPLSPEERAIMPVFLRGAALRFLLTRLYDWLNHPKGALVKPHDPLEYYNKLLFFRADGFSL